MSIEKTATIARHEDLLGYLLEQNALSERTGAQLGGAFPNNTIKEVLRDEFVMRKLDRQNKTANRPPYSYWLTETGRRYILAIQDGSLFKTSCWHDPFILGIYLKYGSEPDFLGYVLAHFQDESDIGEMCRDALSKVTHPAALGVRIGLQTGGNMAQVPKVARMEVPGSYMGAQYTIFAEDGIKRLMRLQEKLPMKKHRSARRGTLSSVLEFCVLFTLTHYNAIEKGLKNGDSHNTPD